MAEQGTAEWHLNRSGCATASAFCDIIATSKRDGKPLKARDDYLWKVATERLYGTPTEAVSAKSMEWGKELEPFAVQAYEVQTGALIIPSGFVWHPTIPYCGASPDGLIEHDGGIEIKCPKDRRVHMQTWLGGMPVEHLPQVQGNMWVNNRTWFDFISYDPRAPLEFQLYVQRIMRDDKYIKALESHVVEFLGEVEALIRKINGNKCRHLRDTNSASVGSDNESVQRE